MNARASIVFCFVLLVLVGAFWIVVEPKIRAENKHGPTGQQMCQDFVEKNPRAEVLHVSEYAVGATAYRCIVLEGENRERLQLAFSVGNVNGPVFSQRDECCVVEGDMVDLALTPKVSPYIQVKRPKP